MSDASAQSISPDAAPPLVVDQSRLTTEGTFDKLWDAGAFDTADEAAAREAKGTDGTKKPPKADKVAPQAQATNEEPEAEVEPATSTDAQELETADAAADAEPGEVEAAPNETEKEFASLDDYLKDAKIDAESFKALPIEVKVDGESKTIPLRDVIKGYQLEQHTQLKSLQLAEERRGFEQEQTNVRTALKQMAEQSQALFNMAGEQLLHDFKQINWQELQATDPGRAALVYQQFQNRQAQINASLQQLNSSKEMEAKRVQEDYAKTLPQEREKLIQARPEWKDPAKYELARKAMFATAKATGFTDQELSNIVDHRYAILLDKAARFDAIQGSKSETLKRVRLAPQMLRPGSRQTRDPKAVASDQARERFQRNPKDEQAGADYFQQFVNN